MGITASGDGRLFALETAHSAYLMKADEYGTLWHLHYGQKIPAEDVSALYHPVNSGHHVNPHDVGMVTRGYSFETIPQELSVFGSGDYRTPSLRVRFEDGSETLRLRFSGYEIREGKYRIDGLPSAHDEIEHAETLVITLRDDRSGLAVELLYGVFPENDVVTRTYRVVNEGGAPVTIEKASVNVDYPTLDYEMITFYGRWARERKPERVKLCHGIRSVGSVRGNSSLQYNPSGLIVSPETTEESGDAYGFAFVYSGDFLMEAEVDPCDTLRFALGIHPDTLSYRLAPGEAFDVPETIMTYSGSGISGVTHAFHRFMNNAIVRGPWRNVPRPVLLNSWEGAYFTFDGDKLTAMAKATADLGIDLFVLDDGWFGKRDSDVSGLGDWKANEEKLGCTLGELADRIRETGVSFGIWMEPEAVSEDSDLYRAHPEWAIRVPGREPSLGRYELLLDLARNDVQEYLVEAITSVLNESRASYLKWDFNRSICDRFSGSLPASCQGEFGYRYMKGLYRILETIVTRFPTLLIEGCSSGGGRFDAGALSYTPQIWTSDDTDPIERLTIQYGTSMIYPVSAMGAHVSASPNHQSGRVTPLRTRAITAMSGTFGYELDPTKLTEEEKDEIREELSIFRKYQDLFRYGIYYRLTTPDDENCTAWEQAKVDGSRAIVSVVYHNAHAARTMTRLRIRGLRDDAHYRLTLLNGGGEVSLSFWGKTLYSGDVYSGSTLRAVGIYAPYRRRLVDYDAFQILVEETDAPERDRERERNELK